MPCIISPASAPTMCAPTTFPAPSKPSEMTRSFMSIFSSSPRPVGMVCFIGLNFEMYTSTLPYVSAACSSVRPQLPIGGWEKTALGTPLWSGLACSPPNIVFAMAMPSMSATGVKAMRFVTSPIAKMLSMFVLLYSSTNTAPLRGSTATPTSSRPICELFGFRPVANMTLSTSSSAPLSVLNTSLPSGASSIAAGLWPAWMWMPLALRSSVICRRTSSSKPRSGISPRNTKCTSDPYPWK
mmetsp:Transcript_156404/g.291915  ORF Transcript_156404/g.291915 Transcript_156404/m.291915 type:complete len:240 (-) Transcript_156404:616-1335(-)